MLVDILSWILLMAGSVLGVTGAWGLMTFPDFYTRVHAASITDTLCAACFIFGLMLQAGWSLVAVKLLMILAVLWITSPTSTHALVRAAYQAGLRAITQGKQRDRGEHS
ncbi:MAG: monovalent cation/H(+) antiporter subunit G [Gammaproteobacteria bacterium]